MKIVKLKGGLGNQMFQYVFAKNLQLISDDVVKLDFSAYKDLLEDNVRKPRLLRFKIDLEIAKPEEIDNICLFSHKGNSLSMKYKVKIFLESLLNKKYFFEKDRAYRSLDDLVDYDYFDGYWQSWKYAFNLEKDICKYFETDSLDEKTQFLIQKVIKQNSVFVGVRRGDYSSEPEHFGSFSVDYYLKAMEIIETRIQDPVYYIFSNDIEWVKNNMAFGERNIIFREKEDIVDDFDDFMIMANCKHSIIINSTYHWWAARLYDRQDKIVIAPKQWFFDNKPIDILPPNWELV